MDILYIFVYLNFLFWLIIIYIYFFLLKSKLLWITLLFNYIYAIFFFYLPKSSKYSQKILRNKSLCQSNNLTKNVHVPITFSHVLPRKIRSRTNSKRSARGKEIVSVVVDQKGSIEGSWTRHRSFNLSSSVSNNSKTRFEWRRRSLLFKHRGCSSGTGCTKWSSTSPGFKCRPRCLQLNYDAVDSVFFECTERFELDSNIFSYSFF